MYMYVAVRMREGRVCLGENKLWSELKGKVGRVEVGSRDSDGITVGPKRKMKKHGSLMGFFSS